MKRWALVTVGLYLTLLGLLTVPVLLLCSFKWSPTDRAWHLEGHASVIELLQSGWYWVWLGVLGSAQLLLLLVPVDVAERRPTSRRKLFVPVVVAGFLLANLFLAGLLAALVAVFRDDGLEIVATPAGWAQEFGQIPAVSNALGSFGITPSTDFFIVLTLFWMMLLFWSLWALVFYHVAKADEPDTLMRRVTRWVLRGSILELLVAVPSHVIVRHRDDCCAPVASFWGIVTGISVMFLSFGPGVLFLFAARIRDRKPKGLPTDS